jgi:TolB-like protein
MNKNSITILLLLLSVSMGVYSQEKIKAAVLNFSYRGADAGLADAIQENFTTAIVSTGYYIMTERNQLDKILKELKMQNSDDFSEDNRKQLGRLTGSKVVFLGSITRIGMQITVNFRVVESETGVIQFADKFMTKDENEIPGLIDDMALRIKQNQENIVRRSIAIYPFYNKTGNKEYQFLSTTIGDVIKSELSSKNQFNILPEKEVMQIVSTSTLSDSDLNDPDKVIPLTLKIKSDVAVTGNYSLLTDQVLITANVINILTGEVTTTVTVNGKAGSDIFSMVKELSSTLADRMVREYPTMDKKTIYVLYEEKNKSMASRIRELESESKKKDQEERKKELAYQNRLKKEFEKQKKEERKKESLKDKQVTEFKKIVGDKRLEDGLHAGGGIMLGAGSVLLSTGLIMLIVDTAYLMPRVTETKNLMLNDISVTYSDYSRIYNDQINLFTASIVLMSLGVALDLGSIPMLVYKNKKTSVSLYLEPGSDNRIGLSIKF